MKQWILIIALLLFSMVSFAKAPAKAKVQNPNTPKNEINVPHALLRGTVNLGTFWLEIPREIVVENNYNPMYGLVTGLVKGTYYAGARLVYSIVDFGLLGFTGPNGYTAKFPEYIWEAQWNPWPQNKPQKAKAKPK